ncbi:MULTISPECIES: hypothetical protein [unclassified Microcoleus]|uniref:hypothetical protein n=1 Tax=unclassified Microcoleus TaxID=2642155 RepID=UPI002FD4DEB6
MVIGHRASGIGHRELGIGNWASGIGHRELGIGNLHPVEAGFTRNNCLKPTIS